MNLKFEIAKYAWIDGKKKECTCDVLYFAKTSLLIEKQKVLNHLQVGGFHFLFTNY